MLSANPCPGGCWPTPQQELLLGASLHGERERAETCWRQWFSETHGENLDEGSFRLLPLAHHNLRRLSVDDPFFPRLEGIHRKLWVESQRMFHSVRPALVALIRAGIPVMVLKGAPLSVSVYPDAGCRPMRDLDILVPEERIYAARTVLDAEGWTRSSWAPRGIPRAYLSYRHGAALRNEDGRELDLHWHLLYWACHSGADHIFWKSAEPFPFLQLPLLAPCAADQLLQLCVHGMEWNEIPPLRWVADVVLLLRAQRDLDWSRVLQIAHDYRLILPLRAALEYVAERFEAPVDPVTSAALRGEAVTRDEYEEFRRYTEPFPSAPGLAYMRGQYASRWHRARLSAMDAVFRLAPLRFVQFLFRLDTMGALAPRTARYALHWCRGKF